MVSKAIIELSTLDLNKVVVTKEEILTLNAQRFEFEQLDKVVYLDIENCTAVGMKHQQQNEFWIRGHIPGRPIMPGVMMIEMAAQLSSVVFHKKLDTKGSVFFGFGGVNNVKFRGGVEPGQDFYMIVQSVKIRPRLAIFEAQGYVENKLVFEGEITGLVI